MITREQFLGLAAELAPQPAAVAASIGSQAADLGPVVDRPQPRSAETSHDRILARARAYLATVPGAVSGQHGHDATFRVACKLIQGFDLPMADALPLLQEWNQRCVPPWGDRDLEHKLSDAAKEPGPRGYLLASNDQDIVIDEQPAPAPVSNPSPAPTPSTNGRHSPDSNTPLNRPVAPAPAPAAPNPAAQPRLRIVVNDHRILRDSIIEQSLTALARSPAVYSRDDLIVQVVHDSAPPKWLSRPDRPPTIAPMPFAVLNVRLASICDYQREQTSEGETRYIKLDVPYKWITSAVDGWPNKTRWLKHLEAVTTAPIFRADGEIIQSPGYDPDSGILYEPDRDYPAAPSHPTRADAQAAVARLFAPLADMPFAKPYHRSAWLSLVLTMVSRIAIPGCVPLFAVDGNQQGVGKGLAIDAACIIANGREPARMALPDEDTELEKRLLSIAIAGDAVVLFDNVHRQIGGSSLEMALTARSIKSRILTISKTAEMSLNAVFLATGNNLTFSADCARRTIPIRIDDPSANPEVRTVRHADLRAYLRANHQHLLMDALTILRAYHLAGRPQQPIQPYGSFEQWSALVRSAIVWLGLPDPCEGRRDLSEVGDSVKSAWLDIFELLPSYYPDPERPGVRASDLIIEVNRRVKEHMNTDDAVRMRDALMSICRVKSVQQLNGNTIGNAFRRRQRQVVEGQMIDCVSDRKKIMCWFVAGSGTHVSADPAQEPAQDPAGSNSIFSAQNQTFAGSAGSVFDHYPNTRARDGLTGSAPADPADPACTGTPARTEAPDSKVWEDI